MYVVVFAFGSEEKGQLANGQAGERIVSAGKSAFDYETEPSECDRLFAALVSVLSTRAVLVRGLVERKIVKIACGSQHAIALDSDGYARLLREPAVYPTDLDYSRVYGWGYNGYCRQNLTNDVRRGQCPSEIGRTVTSVLPLSSHIVHVLFINHN